MHKMKTYQVGGCVRDILLGIEHHDVDYVIVGAQGKDIDMLLEKGFNWVGAAFPVLLSPDNVEYALARIEAKVGQGYHGFACEFGPHVTLEEDCYRRDLTINAIAFDPETQEYFDPYGGMKDIQEKYLRHVSHHFKDDPVRALRLARFAARFENLGFTVHPDTKQLVREMINNGELDHLVPERVWEECTKAMKFNFTGFLRSLHDLGVLEHVLPEVAALDGVPQPAAYHPEIDTLIHTFMCVEQAEKMRLSPECLWAVLLHDLGKAVTPSDQWPKHLMHEKLGVPLVKDVCERLKVPNSFKELALMVCEHHLDCHKVKEFKPSTLVKRFKMYGAYRFPERFKMFLKCCEADARGRTGFEDREYTQGDYYMEMFEIAASVKFADLNKPNLEPQKIQESLERLRTSKISQKVK